MIKAFLSCICPDCTSPSFLIFVLSILYSSSFVSLLWLRFLHLPVVCDVYEEERKRSSKDEQCNKKHQQLRWTSQATCCCMLWSVARIKTDIPWNILCYYLYFWSRCFFSFFGTQHSIQSCCKMLSLTSVLMWVINMCWWDGVSFLPSVHSGANMT